MNSEPPPSWTDGAMALRLRGLVRRSRPACAHACWKTGALNPPPPLPSAAAIPTCQTAASSQQPAPRQRGVIGGGGDGGDWCRIAVVATANAAARLSSIGVRRRHHRREWTPTKGLRLRITYLFFSRFLLRITPYDMI